MPSGFSTRAYPHEQYFFLASGPIRPMKRPQLEDPPPPPLDPTTQYAQDVVDGKIIAGPPVRDACRRHLRDLEEGSKRGLVFDVEEAQFTFDFFGEILRLNGGEFEGKPFLLEPSQKFIVGSLFGWKTTEGVRRFRQAYIEQGKGTGKSPLVAGIGIKMLVADNESRAEVYAAATKRDQAQVLFRDAVAMVDLSPELDRTLKRTGGKGHEWNIAHEDSGSFFRTLASDDSQSGPRPHCGLLDEVHEHKSSLMVDMMRLGTKGRRQPLILMITNSGSDKQSVCWRYHDYAIKVGSGMLEDDTFFSYVCSLDIERVENGVTIPADDPFEDESCWIKVNPLLGVSIKKEYLREQVREAKGMPSKASRVRRLNFCQWVDSANPWLPDHIWLAARDTDFDEDKLRNRTAYGGLDLSSTLALTAFVLEFEPTEYDPYWRQKAWFWLPSESVDRIEKDYQLDYLRAWIASGFIDVTKGSAVNKLKVLAKIVSLCSQYNVRAIGYDRWRIEDLKMLMNEEGVKLPLIEFGQGYKDMSPAVEAYETKISNGQIKHDGNPVLSWNVSSVVIESDPANNRKLTKAGSTGLIDGAVAMVMAEGIIGKAPPPVRHQFFSLGKN